TLNRIIQLQAIVELVSNKTARALELITSNKTARALELITKQQSQTRAAVHQNWLALDYLLAEEWVDGEYV
ncbi:ENR1 protein, partial [Bucco capensis]|nr:ENR1 protein [Bucco capensis]